MSERKRKVPVPATEREERDTLCDICGKSNDCDSVHIGESDWESEPEYGRAAYERVEVKRTHCEIGYEQDGTQEGEAWDFCPTCFDERVRPLLLELAKPRKVDVSW